MQTLWQLSQDGNSASRILDNGSFESRLVIAIPADELATALPADLPAQAQIVAELESAIQSYIDSKAQAKGYDSANSCISYLNSSNTVWKSDATSMNAWRDSAWEAAYTDQASATPSTTWQQVLAILPTAPW
jgi:hypothetical protein